MDNTQTLLNRHERRRHKALARQHARQARRRQAALRTALLASATIGILAAANVKDAQAQVALNPPGTIPAQCSVVGNAAVCEGDLSAGLDADGPVLSDLTIRNLTTQIAPAGGLDGVDLNFVGNGDVNLTVDTGAFGMNITGAPTDGIGVDFTGNGTVTVGSTGHITSDSDAIGVVLTGNGTVAVDSTGNLNVGSDGIQTRITGNGIITIRSTGDIDVGTSDGLEAAIANDGDISITSVGNITTGGDGGSDAIDATVNNGTIRIHSTGNITTGGDGFDVDASGTGSITITSVGNVVATGVVFSDGFEIGIGNGTVTIDSTGDIVASDDGIEVDANAGTVSISSTGDITSLENGAAGVSLSEPASTADSTVTIHSGSTVTGGPGTGDGVRFASGRVNRLNNRGTIQSAGGSAVEGATGDEQIYNQGTLNGTVSLGDGTNIVSNAAGGIITGDLTTGTGNDSFFNNGTFTGTANLGDGDNVVTNTSPTSFNGALITGAGNDTATNSGAFNGTFDLGGGTNVFNNIAGGVLNSGATLSVGAGNALNNAGTLSPGGSGAIRTTALTGNLVQTSDGIFLASVGPGAGTGDLVTVTGTANLAGNVQAEVVNPTTGTQSVTILSATGGTTSNGLGLLASPALQASLSFPNANDVVLTTSIDFSAGGLNPNQTALAGSLNSAVEAGVSGLDPVLLPLLNNVFTIGDYRNALNQLLPEVVLNTETSTLFSSEAFIDNLFSCRLAGDNHTALDEGECFWARPQGRFLDRDSDANTIGFDETSGGLAAGAQVAVAPNWFAGFALGYERASLDTDTGAETDSNRFSGGLSLKYQAGSFLLGAAISAGVSGNDTQRPISFGGVGGFNATAESNYAIKTLTGQARAAYVFQIRDWFAKPLVDVTATYLSRDGVTETGADAANLALSGSDETFFSVTPALEIGGDFALSETAVIRPYVRAGVSYYTDSDHGLTASFVNAPAGTNAFSINSSFNDVFADVAAGATAYFENGSTLGISYDGLISSDTQQHGISVKGTWRF